MFDSHYYLCINRSLKKRRDVVVFFIEVTLNNNNKKLLLLLQSSLMSHDESQTMNPDFKVTQR